MRAAEEAERVRSLEGQLRDRRVARKPREYVAEFQALLDDAGLGYIEHSDPAEHLRLAAGCRRARSGRQGSTVDRRGACGAA